MRIPTHLFFKIVAIGFSISGYAQAQYIAPVNIAYPAEAIKQKIEGKVVVRILLKEDGTPERAEISESSNEIFNASSLASVMKMRFKPYVENGVPTKAYALIPLNYKLPKQE